MPSRARAWAFTVNYADGVVPDLHQEWNRLREAGVIYIKWVHEKEACDHHHVWLYFSSVKSFNQAKALFPRSGQCEPATEGWEKYLEKSGSHADKAHTRVGGPWELGSKPAQGKRNDILAFVEQAKAKDWKSLADVAADGAHDSLIIKYPRGLSTYLSAKRKARAIEPALWWFYGDGGSGKSDYLIFSEGVKEEEVFRLDSEAKGWFSAYNGQKYLVIDEVEACKEITYGWLLQWTRGARVRNFSRKLESSVPSEVEVVVITSNRDPDDTFPEKGVHILELVERCKRLWEFRGKVGDRKIRDVLQFWLKEAKPNNSRGEALCFRADGEEIQPSSSSSSSSSSDALPPDAPESHPWQSPPIQID